MKNGTGYPPRKAKETNKTIKALRQGITGVRQEHKIKGRLKVTYEEAQSLSGRPSPCHPGDAADLSSRGFRRFLSKPASSWAAGNPAETYRHIRACITQ